MRSLPVVNCRTCPFLQPTPLQSMFQILIPFRSGFCGYHESTSTFAGVIELGLPDGPTRDDNIDQLPANCPLRAGDITVTIAS